MRIWMLVLTLVPLLLAAAACGGGDGETDARGPTATRTPDAASPVALPQGDEPVRLDPSDFTADIDHPYWPMAPGSTWVYRETDGEGGEQRVVVTVTEDTRLVMGIEARVVHDEVTEGGEVAEDTYDWYAQDRWGNLWYLGEDTKAYEGGKVSSAGSWEAGVDGAQPGVILPGRPRVGMAYRQEYYEGEAEDTGEILSLDERAEVPFGSFEHMLMTRDLNRLEPSLVENKLYARGVGPVLAVTVAGGADREELVRFERAP